MDKILQNRRDWERDLEEDVEFEDDEELEFEKSETQEKDENLESRLDSEDDEKIEEPYDKNNNANEELETAQGDPTTRRLRVLQNLLDEGLITKNDFNAKKKIILDDL